MLARQQISRGHQGALPAGFGDMDRGHRRHQGLPGADIALQKPRHRSGQTQIGDDRLDRLTLAVRWRKGQSRERLGDEKPFRRDRRAGFLQTLAAPLGHLHLAGEQFVIGKALER